MSAFAMFPQLEVVGLGLVHLIRATIIGRPKLGGPMTHFGTELLLQDRFGRQHVRVLDLRREGPRLLTRKAFLAGRQAFEFDSESQPSALRAVAERVLLALKNLTRFNIVENNCEHFARYILRGVHESLQKDGVVFFVAVVAVVALVALVVAKS